METVIDKHLTPALRDQLHRRVQTDDWARLPQPLYPEQPPTTLKAWWDREYRALFAPVKAGSIIHHMFAPAPAAEIQPRYLADPAGRWYALIGPRYNRRTERRFCYVRYWWAADLPALQALIEAVLRSWQAVPFGWLKLRLGYGTELDPETVHPRASIQSYLVAGRVSRMAVDLPGGLRLETPATVDARWWPAYQALLDEQEQLAPEFATWAAYEAALEHMQREMVDLLAHGGGVVNLWRAARLIGHISWEPAIYEEQLIARCWHINNIIVAADQRRQGLGQTLHHLAAARMNLRVTPIVAGLINAKNFQSLKTAAKIGRHIVDSYLIVPKEA